MAIESGTAEQEKQLSEHSDLAGQQTTSRHVTDDLRMSYVIVRRLWFFFIVIFLTVTMFSIVGPLFQYVMLTFFASRHGSGDCMAAPASTPCRLAAGDLTTYNSIVGSLTSAVSVVSAVTLGSISDRIGRRTIFTIKGILSTATVYALALYQLAGVTLWVFLFIKPLAQMWDFNGVSMALMADVIPERDMRGAAMSITIALSLSVVLICSTLSAVLPVQISFGVALVAGTMKLVFYFTCFPETAKVATCPDSIQRQGPLGALRAAARIIGRSAFISRLACIAVIGAISSVGSGLVMQPFLTSYVGIDHKQLALLMGVVITSVLVTLGLLAKPMTKHLGDVRTYQCCLLVVALFPAGLCVCSAPWQVIALMGLLTGPMFLQVPIISAIKSNLVSDAEQGLVQGALASLCNLAAAVAAPLFGYMYNSCTEGGLVQSPRTVCPPLLAASAVGLLAFLVSLSLPTEVPLAHDHDANDILSESLLSAKTSPLIRGQAAGA